MSAGEMHHMGLTVSDLEASVAFYELLGFEVTERIQEEGEEVERGVGVPGARLNVAMLGRPGGRLELIEYARPGAGGPLPNHATGAAHVCVEVEDVDAEVERLQEQGVEFVSPPITHESGIRWVYARDPDGITAELIQVLG